jgi:hypothetical protein
MLLTHRRKAFRPVEGVVESTTDPFFANVSVLLHLNGTNGSTTIVDSGPGARTFTAFGNAQLSTTNPKYGTACLLLDGNGDYLSSSANTAYDFGVGDFSIEFWVNFTGTGTQYIMDYAAANTSVIAITPSSGNVFVYCQGSFCINSGSTPFTTSQWYFIQLIRSGGTWTIFRDGVQYAQATGQTTRTFGSSALALLVGIAGNGAAPTNGRIDEFRMTKGTARAASLPISAFPDS